MRRIISSGSSPDWPASVRRAPACATKMDSARCTVAISARAPRAPIIARRRPAPSRVERARISGLGDWGRGSLCQYFVAREPKTRTRAWMVHAWDRRRNRGRRRGMSPPAPDPSPPISNGLTQSSKGGAGFERALRTAGPRNFSPQVIAGRTRQPGNVRGFVRKWRAGEDKGENFSRWTVRRAI